MILKLKAGRFKIHTQVTQEKGRIFFDFPFNRDLMAEIKSMHNHKYHGYDTPPRKVWSVKDCHRNRFQLAFLAGQNPYEPYEAPLKQVKVNRDCLYLHQREMKAHILTRRQCMFACEMRTGKTLAAIEAMEDSGFSDWVWVGPRSALAGVKVEFDVWDAKLRPRFMTYDRLRLDIEKDEFGAIPDGIIFDESTKLKNATTKRAQACYKLVEMMRQQREDCYIVCMSGAPAPKDPTNWWNQCEIACPGFLKEGDVYKFRDRLAIIREEEGITGVYPKLVAWLDDERKCSECGMYPEDHYVKTMMGHDYKQSRNEVAYLYERMKGLVIVKFKEDCLDLPPKQFRKIEVEPTQSIKRAAGLIAANEARAITVLIKHRELSDGFQYEETKTNEFVTCSLCKGSKEALEWYDPDFPDEYPSQEAMESGRCKERPVECYECQGVGTVPKVIRTAKEVPCPKEQVLIDLLDEHEAIGRFVIYAGFEASVDRCVRVALKYGWDVIRCDGRGWAYFGTNGPETLTDVEMLKRFKLGDQAKVCFIGQPGAGGMGIDLAASPSTFFYSNTFNGEDRMQALERIHGPAMDRNRGCTIIDVVHLKTDQIILENLQKKIDLQRLTMGKLKEAFND